jgi:hypothetical protein
MAGAYGLGGFAAGFGKSLTDVLLGHRQQQEQKKLVEVQTLLPAALKHMEETGDSSLAENIIGNWDPEFAANLKKHSPFANLSKLMGPQLKMSAQQPEMSNAPTQGIGGLPVPPPESAPPGMPQEPAPLPSRTVATEPVPGTTAPTGHTFFNTPIQTPEERATQEAKVSDIKLNAISTGLIQRARDVVLPALKQMDPTATIDDAFAILGVDMRRAGRTGTGTGTHAPVGKPLTQEDVASIPPEQFLDVNGMRIPDRTIAPAWQTMRGPKGETYYIPAPTPAAAAAKLPPGDAGQFVATVLMSKGVDPTKAQEADVRAALPEAAKLAREKLGDTDVLRHTLESLRDVQILNTKEMLADLPTADDVQQAARTITVNGRPYKYVSRGDWTGARAQNAAANVGQKAGVLVVSPQESSQLASAEATMHNLDAFYAQLKSKLPADAQDRPLTSITNKMSQFFQSDDQIGAMTSWDLEVIPMLRSLLVNNRLTNVEFTRALEARPKVTDTVGVAAQKMANIKTILTNAVKPILERSGTTVPPQTFTATLNGKVYSFDSQSKLDTFHRQFPTAK